MEAQEQTHTDARTIHTPSFKGLAFLSGGSTDGARLMSDFKHLKQAAASHSSSLINYSLQRGETGLGS